MGGTETLAFDAVRRILRTKEEASRDTRGGVRCLRAGGTRASYVHERLAFASVEVAALEGPRATGRRHRFGDREPARFRETWTRPWSLTPQTRGAIFLVFDANRPSFTVYFFPRDGNENERIGTNSARKTKKKKNDRRAVGTRRKRRKTNAKACSSQTASRTTRQKAPQMSRRHPPAYNTC
jgi:hypothetical protein